MTPREKNKELEIIKGLKKGDTKSLEFLFDSYYERLKTFANIIVKDSFLSEEIVCDFFTNFWFNRNKIEIKENLKSYLYKGVKNRAISAIRKSKKEIVKELNEYFEIKSDCSPEKKIINEEEIKKINNILDLIPPRSKEVFILHRYDNFKYKEIAELLGISVKTVENHIVKALRILRDYYKQNYNSLNNDKS